MLEGNFEIISKKANLGHTFLTRSELLSQQGAAWPSGWMEIDRLSRITGLSSLELGTDAKWRHLNIHTDRHTYSETDRQTDIHTYIHAYIHTCIHTYMWPND